MHTMKRSSTLALSAMSALTICMSLAQDAHAVGKAAHTQAGKARAASSNTGPSRQQVLDLVKNTCPDRIGELLSKAMPTQKPTDAQIGSVCACVNDKVTNEPQGMGADELQHESTYHALNCAQPMVREYNAGWVRSQFGSYLVGKRAWQPESVDTLALCLADTLWNQNFNPDRHGKRQEPSGADYWALCTGRAGHANEPLPTPETLGVTVVESPQAKP
jgi:hypothetical protein